MEEYREYRRRKSPTTNKKAKRISFSKKFGYQSVISFGLLITVCILKFSVSDSIVNSCIKDAVLYQPDTSGITNALDNIFNLYTEEGNNNEETEFSENL